MGRRGQRDAPRAGLVLLALLALAGFVQAHSAQSQRQVQASSGVEPTISPTSSSPTSRAAVVITGAPSPAPQAAVTISPTSPTLRPTR